MNDYNLISKVNFELKTKGYPLASKSARQWLYHKLKELRMTPRSIMKDLGRQRETIFVGKLYFFFYEAKLQKVLPFWDRFPLVIPLERYSDGFLGLNLHYVPVRVRMAILSKLSERLNNQKMDESTRMKVSYDYIASLKVSEMMKPCIKRYLYSNIRSRFLLINPGEWYFSCLLPFEQFEKQTKKQILGETRV